MCEKHLQHQRDLCHVSIDFKKAFNRKSCVALWATMKKYISANVILVDKAICRVFFNTELKVNGQQIETVTSFRYLGSVISDASSEPEIFARIAQTTAALTKLTQV